MALLLKQPDTVAPPSEHWDALARAYHQLGAPLHPSAQDLAALTKFLTQLNGELGSQGVNALMWGATPALANLNWPAGSRLLAVDRSQGMLKLVWPGDLPQQRAAQCTDWFSLRPATGAYDVVVGDGSFNCLPYPTGYQQLGNLTRQALQPKGALITRFYVKPAKPETLDRVFQAALAGQIHSFHAFKWRLAMAILGEHQVNIAVRDIWQTWQQAGLDQGRLRAVTGWSAATIATINHYQFSDASYSFPTLPEIEQALAACFVVSKVATPTYELGERCPTVMFRPKNYV